MSTSDIVTARGVRLGATPSVSVIVASTSPLPVLEDLLRTLEPQCLETGAQLVVVRPDDEGLPALLERHPSVVFAAADGNGGIGVLRAVGLSLAKGDIVAITEDTRTIPEGWVKELTERQLTR